MMKFLLLFLIVVPLVGLSNCRSLERASAEKPPLTRCLDDLETIPAMAALLKDRSKKQANPEGEGEKNERPLEGMEMALTINSMVRSQGEPEGGEDNWCSNENSVENFNKILDALKRNDIPPTVSFIMGENLDEMLVRRWLQSGNLIGNMTYSRAKTRKKGAEKFIEDVERNDEVLAPFWKDFPPAHKYFRFPRLKPGRTEEIRTQIRAFLNDKKYVEVPATIDAWDNRFSGIYCAALAREDQNCANLVTAHFKTLMLAVVTKARAVGRKRTGHDVKHILMVGANQFTADTLADMLAWYKSLGVKFITLDEALSDPIYSSVDDKGKPASRALIRAAQRGSLSEK